METREELKKKIALCDKLGASKFQPAVLKFEQLKFKVLKDIFPSLPERYEKHCRKNRDKALEKAKTPEEREQILANYRRLIIDWRRELKREQNRNYHMDENKPTEIIEYLKWNKKVHQKGLIKDSVLLGATIAGLALGVAPALLGTALAYELFATFIDFQCINIQNSHIYRYKLTEKAIQRREERRSQALVDNYGESANVYARSIANNVDLPTLQEMIAHVQTKEEAIQLRKMILEHLETSKKEVHPVSTTKEPVTENITVTTQEQQPENSQPSTEIVQTATPEMLAQADLEIEKMVQEGANAQESAVQKHRGGK